MLDLKPEPDAVLALLPAQAIRDIVAAQVAALSRVRRVPDRYVAPADAHLRKAQPYAIPAIARVREQIPVLPVLIAEPEVVHQRRTQRTCHRQQALIRPVPVLYPVGLQRRAPVRTQSAVAVMRVPRRQMVLLAQRIIELRAQRLPSVWASEIPGQAGRRGQIWLKRKHLRLVHAFQIEKEEKLVFLDRPANPKARIPSREKRIRRRRAALQARIRRHVVVPEKEVPAAMELVAPAPRNHVHRAHARNSGRQIEVNRRKLKLLHHFLAEVHPAAALNRIANVPAIHRDRRLVRIAPQHRNRKQRVVLRRAPGSHRHSRLQKRQIQKTAPVQRQFLNLLPRDHPFNGVPLVFHLRGGRFHRHDVFALPYLQMQIHRGRGPYFDDRFPQNRPEPAHRAADFIYPGRQCSHVEAPVRSAGDAAAQAGIFLRDVYLCVLDDGARFIGDGPRDRARWSLSQRRAHSQ